MRIHKIMTRNPIWATVDTKLNEIARLMKENNCSYVLIFKNEEDRRPTGIITDRDIAIRAIGKNINSAELTAVAIMTRNLIKVSMDADIETCYQKLRINKIQHLPIVDNEGNLQGVVTKADLDHRILALETARILRLSEGYAYSGRRREGADILL